MSRRQAAVLVVSIVVVVLLGWVSEVHLDRGDPLPPPAVPPAGMVMVTVRP